MAETDILWGGSLLSVVFDPVAWTVRVEVEVMCNGEEHRYQLSLDGVTQWRSTRETPLVWGYAELTEVHVSELEDQAAVQMVIWVEEDFISALCSRTCARDSCYVAIPRGSRIPRRPAANRDDTPPWGTELVDLTVARGVFVGTFSTHPFRRHVFHAGFHTTVFASDPPKPWKNGSWQADGQRAPPHVRHRRADPRQG